MQLKFAKMQALGNDFVVLDGVTQALVLSPEQCRRIADRRLGIGCDQILVVDPAPTSAADFGYRIFNADGSEVGQCGNGARCLARFVERRGLSSARSLIVATQTTRMRLELRSGGWVSAELAAPVFAPAGIPLRRAEEASTYLIASDFGEISGGAVNVGNPHFVIRVEDVETAAVERWGAQLMRHADFPQGVNVGFVQKLDEAHLRLRVYERGVGETPACGSGACAAAVLMRRWGEIDSSVNVDLPGGRLRVNWVENQPIFLEGPADWVFEGEMTL